MCACCRSYDLEEDHTCELMCNADLQLGSGGYSKTPMNDTHLFSAEKFFSFDMPKTIQNPGERGP